VCHLVKHSNAGHLAGQVIDVLRHGSRI
jgi:hypothetical protein